MKRITSITATAAVIAAAALAVNASAAKPPSVGEETLGNNLSVPAIFVPDTTGAPAQRIDCPSTAVAPGADGAPTSVVYPGYWLQKTEATWTAECTTAAAGLDVTADWGDNLTESPTLAAGRPIRVEVGLLDPTATGMTGYVITNLTPTLEDRLATYGTDGTDYQTGEAGAPVTRVYDDGAWITIEKQLENGDYDDPLVDEKMTAEINSTGAIVYGYNWGTKGRKNTPSTGTYRLTFTADNTDITALTDVGALRTPTLDTTNNSTSVVVTLATRGGGGGSKGKPTTATGAQAGLSK